ncbi:MAG: oleate hydratase [Adlercreutzia equolifaciens]
MRENNPAAIDAAEGCPKTARRLPPPIRAARRPFRSRKTTSFHHARQPGGPLLLRQPGRPRPFRPELTPGDGWDLWKRIAAQSPEFGRPEKFCGDGEEQLGKRHGDHAGREDPALYRGHLQARPAFRRRCHGRHRVGEGLQLAALLDHQPPAAVPRPARGAGVRVALRPVHRRARRLREEAHARLHRQGNLRGVAVPPGRARSKSRAGRAFREHGALHDALHHGLLHAPRRWRPSARRA